MPYSAASGRSGGLVERLETVPVPRVFGLGRDTSILFWAWFIWGLGAGLWLGMGLETTRRDLVQAVLEGIALRAAEVLGAMDRVAPLAGAVSVDGGLSRNGYFCRFLADALGREVVVPASAELTGLGIAQLALIGAGGRGIAVRRHLEKDLPPVLVDRIQIHQVITNLIRNSIDALEVVKRREIVISTCRAGSRELEIAVADTGPGLAPEISDKLFQPFVTTKPSGLGIGLSICRSIVEGHDGRLWASDNPGGGTIFHVSLPVVPASGESDG